MDCQSINAALRACMPCPAAPAVRRFVLADRVSSDRAQPGFQVLARLNSVPARDSLGRIAHVRGIYLLGTVCMDVATALGSPVTAYQLRSIWSSIYLQDVSGHIYWPSIDGRDIADDNFFRHGAHVQATSFAFGPNGIAGGSPLFPPQSGDYGYTTATPAPSTDVRRNFSLYAPLVSLNPGMNPLAGLIPLASLQRQSNQGSLRFTLRSALPGGFPAGMTYNATPFRNALGQPGVDVWLDVVYLPALAVGPAWTLDSYTLTDTSGILRRPEDTTEHVHFRYYPEDAPGGAISGQGAVANMSGFTVTTAGFTEVDGFELADMLAKMFLTYGSDPMGAIARKNAAQDLPLIDTTSGDPQTLMILPYRQRGSGPAKGSVNYRIATPGSNTFFRFNHRTVSCNEEKMAQAQIAAAQCDPCSRTVMTDATGKPVAAGDAFKSGVALVLDPAANKAA